MTRSSSAYMMLESVNKTYSENLFAETNSKFKCPIKLETIEIYLQILKPAYLLNISFQNNHSSIADTLIGKF